VLRHFHPLVSLPPPSHPGRSVSQRQADGRRRKLYI
jgi:hypothetical protein